MCLSTVYRGEKTPENIVMSNVQSIEVQDGQLLLTDLMERQVVVVGTLVSVDLVGGTAVVRERSGRSPISAPTTRCATCSSTRWRPTTPWNTFAA